MSTRRIASALVGGLSGAAAASLAQSGIWWPTVALAVVLAGIWTGAHLWYKREIRRLDEDEANAKEISNSHD